MDRRSFITLSGAGVVSSSLLLAGCHSNGSNIDKAKMAGGVYFTKNSPGRWIGKEGGHLPQINIDDKNKKIIVNTNHKMTSYEHYIVKHVILDKNCDFLDENVFEIGKDSKAISEFSLSTDKLKGYSGTLYALSMCNLHDVWLNEITIT